MRTSNPALSPAGDSDPVYTGSWRRRGWCNCLCTPSQDQTWQGAPHASATVLARQAPARGRRPASAPRAPAGAAPRAPSRVYTNLFARDWVDPARSLRQGPGWGTPDTGLTPRLWPARAPAFRGAEPATPQCPKPRRPHAPGARSEHTKAPRPTPHSSPRLRTSALSSGGAGGLRAEPRARSGASGGRGAGERAPSLHMLTRAARGQRPASAGS